MRLAIRSTRRRVRRKVRARRARARRSRRLAATDAPRARARASRARARCRARRRARGARAMRGVERAGRGVERAREARSGDDDDARDGARRARARRGGSGDRARSRGRRERAPNALCVGRIVAGPALAYGVASGASPELVLGGVAAAAFTDYLDGFLARRWKQGTILGSYLDTIADMVFVG